MKNFTIKLNNKMLYITAFTLTMLTSNAQSVFGWETASVVGLTTQETVNGVTLTFTGGVPSVSNGGDGLAGITGNSVNTSNAVTSTSFSFSQAVNISSILALDALETNSIITFTPTGGSNSPVAVQYAGGIPPTGVVNLNWTGVTSFVVSISSTFIPIFDNLNFTVAPMSASSTAFETNKIEMFPNPTNDVLHIKSNSVISAISITNSLGQTVFSQDTNLTNTTINLSNLAANTYFVKTIVDGQTVVKKIIKQ